MDRRKLREEIQSTWTVLEPRVPGTPFTRKDLADADELSARGEPSRPRASTPLDAEPETDEGTLAVTTDDDRAVVKR